ncbi:hypothetical protein Tco_0293501, partial [Tanacetum coccineum]
MIVLKTGNGVGIGIVTILESVIWKDIWIGDSPLNILYNRLYQLELDKDCLIIDRIENGQWSWNWLYQLELDKDCLIIDRIENGQWSWNWYSNDLGVQARRVIDDKILPSLATSTSWDKTLPRKVNIF